MKSLFHPVVKFIVAAGALLGAAEVSAQSVLSIHSQATGQTRVYTEGESLFSVDTTPSGLVLNSRHGPSGDQWSVRLDAPIGEKLKPGRYDYVGCPEPYQSGRAAGLGVTDNNPVCTHEADIGRVFGWFTIRQIAYDGTGKVASLEATFSQRLGSTKAPELGGFLRFRASPVSFSVKSDRGFSWGVINQDNHGDSSVFALDGTTAGIRYDVSALRDHWSIALAPSTGNALRVGSFRTRGAADASNWGLNVRRTSGVAACAGDSNGLVTVHGLNADGTGRVLGLHATFEYRCGTDRPALRGVIRYGM